MKQTRQPALLVLLITAIVVIGWSGTTLKPANRASDDDLAIAHEAAATSTDVQDVLKSAATEPMAMPTVTIAPTVVQTLVPTDVPAPSPTPTPEPVETPRPVPPENPYDQSFIIDRGESGRSEVALTFDAGEGTGEIDKILDFLADHNIKVSFGITGEWARANPAIVQQMIDGGHQLFNHSDTHLSWTGVSTTGEPIPADVRVSELDGAEQAVYDETGYSMKPFFRPPYGDYDLAGLELLKAQGYEYMVWWTCDSLGWQGATAEEVVASCGPDAEGGGPGGIILMHITQEEDYRALDQLVAAYEAEGYDFVTIEQMIQP